MPFIERDAWRRQYFLGIDCPASVDIPTDDMEAWRLFPNQRWIYNKLLIAESQGIRCAPHGVAPTHYPVFSKPIYNLHGMGVGSRAIHSDAEHEHALQAGHMWAELLEGDHVSTDLAVVRGEVHWLRHTHGRPLAGGAFDYWMIEAEDRPALTAYCRDWIARHLADYTGMLNLETLGGRIIEAHLRFADQWPDLYGAGWLDAVVGLYTRGAWRWQSAAVPAGYSVVLFAPHGLAVGHPPEELLAEVLAQPDISSVQITFEPGAHGRHAMPPGGFRVAIVNAWNLQAGVDARQALARYWALER